MSSNENNFENGGYVPKFERDLQKAGGDISALTEDKKRERASADEIDMEIDVSSLRKPDENSADAAEELSIDVEETAPQDENASNEAEEEDLDFIYGEDENYNYSGSLDEISVESIALDDIDVKVEEMRTDKSSIISSLKNQMQADDLAMSVTNRPKLDDMSEEYAPTRKTASDVVAKEQLDKDEKELIKTRLKTEMESKPEGYDKKKSLAMYKKLMEEQKAKSAKRGFIQLLITAAVGLISAVVIFLIKPNADGLHPLFDYLPVGTLVFSILMLLKSKFFKIFSTLFFIAETVVLIYPGLVGYALDPDNQDLGTDYIIKIAMYAAAVALCAVTFIRLASNKDIEEYYSYRPSSKGRR